MSAVTPHLIFQSDIRVLSDQQPSLESDSINVWAGQTVVKLKPMKQSSNSSKGKDFVEIM